MADAPATPTPPPPPVLETTLEDFCRDLSNTDLRPELIAGFFSDERANARQKDTAEKFAARYEAFQKRPA